MDGTQEWVTQRLSILPPPARVVNASRSTSVQYLERAAERLGKLPAVSSKQAVVWITLEVPMPDRRTPLRSSFLARLPRSAGAALIVAFVLFAGGYAAGHEAQRAASFVAHPLE